MKRSASIALLLLAGYGGLRAAQLAWICDDAFVSLRYADNWNRGLGLVFNAGEYVEGYTNFLWTLLLGAVQAAGAEPVAAAQWLGWLAYAALAAFLAFASWEATTRRALFLPLAAALVLVSDDFHQWATGGLETMLFAALAAPALWLTRRPEPGGSTALAAGLLCALLVLTRLDGVLVAGVAVLSPWLGVPGRGARRNLRLSLLVGAPVAVTLALWLPWKLFYYGDVLPTAFYSKSATDPYLGQGLFYLRLYFQKNWVVLPGAAALLAALWWTRGRRKPTREAADAGVYLAAAVLYLAHVAWVGGDFMFARRIVVVMPLLFLAAEIGLAMLAPSRLATAAALLAVLAAALPYPVYGGTRLALRGVSNERLVYTEQLIAFRRRQALRIARALEGTPVRMVFQGGLCVFAYYSRLPWLAESTGLTQYSLAKLPIEKRGRIGHEKAPNAEWLRENDVHLLLYHDPPGALKRRGPRRFDEVDFLPFARARIVRYSDSVMDALRGQEGIEFEPIEDLLARRREQIRTASPESARRVMAELERYYLDGDGARARERAREFGAILEARGIPAN